MAEKKDNDGALEIPYHTFDIPGGEFAVYGTVYTDPAHADDVEAVYKQTTRRALSPEEPGTIYYCISRDRTDPSIFHFFERYESEEAFHRHNEQDLVKNLVTSGWMRDVKAVFVKPIVG